MNWTKPYYGIQHLCIPEVRGQSRRYQVTINDCGSFATIWIADLWNRPWTCPLVDTHLPSAEEARTFAEGEVKRLGIIPA